MRGTEGINPLSAGMDKLSTVELLELMHADGKRACEAVGSALPEIARAVEAAIAAVRGGGKVCYAGAGTSGRMGAIDAAEVLPTFGSGDFTGFIAGGEKAMTRAVEGAEDDAQEGKKLSASLNGNDLAIGVSASGTTPFVLGFLKGAKERGAGCWLITSNKVQYEFLDGLIELATGPEIIAGSTRLKAGTAQKICLNMISSAVMTGLGKVYDGYMVGVVAGNKKLMKRAAGIVCAITGAAPEEAERILRSSGMSPRTAVVMIKKSVDRQEAERMLEQNGGLLRGLID
jgi:N-acetylmuramic acid 6-phosphate etherase